MGRRRLVVCGLAIGLAAFVACDDAGTPVPTRGTLGWPDNADLETLRDHLHSDGSGAEAHELFPDLALVYVDDGHGKPFPSQILPIRYFWSPSGQFTVAICNIEKTLFICPYRVSSLIAPGEYARCDVSDYYVRTEGAP
jgi:hypothetical protein